MEDERFLGILEDGVKKQSDGRYVMPLPLKSDSVCLPEQLVEGSLWLTGPEFLWRSGPCEPENVELPRLQDSDPEVKKVSVLTTKVRSVAPFPDQFEISRLDGVSSWYRAIKVIALCLPLKSKLQRTLDEKTDLPKFAS